MVERLLDRLFRTAKSYIAALDGQESVSAESKIDTVFLSSEKPAQALQALHQTLREAHPETGAPYWRVRCWGLVCWQPIYLAMISVYQLKAVPLSLHEIEQKQQGEMIAGYVLADGEWQEGCHEALIKAASEQLNRIFMPFETAHVEAFGGRPALYKGLLADQLMSALIAVRNVLPDEQKHTLEKDFCRWAHAMNLPLKPLAGLAPQTAAAPVFVRHTCCLHFRRDQGELCANCPRLHKRSAKMAC
ncbi:siderophore ferric iron reductase [Marinomonas sp. M1K-6]|uniref:Siderophore ferric iron reductase n=1 Tax=Marinomonas profundi TaxID=2726122 RepID=A0A847R4Z4_9GAMM|nr:siderophore ferric iron reductase [Marinomonas profundi]NLQ17116.1 siderophore ferric iron reductase [Marinomonas profundi]UDV04687.1 siderophore ferric iron reductase [Marinomonas profundi]